jgi:uncharacterized protein YtpQ (UPF0354 family)
MLKRWLAPLCLALAFSPATHAALSPEAFTQEYVSVLRAALPGFKVEAVGHLEVRVRDAKGGEVSTAYLDNAFNQYLADPDSRQEIIERHVSGIAEINGEDTPLRAEQIVPIVKVRGWIDDMRQASIKAGRDKPPEQVFEALNDVLVVVYAEDTPRNINYFPVESLGAAGLKREQLRELAVTNLRRLLTQIEIHSGPEYSMITAGGNYEASLLLFEEFWQGDNKLKVDGEIVVAVPARDLLLVTGSRNAGGIRKLREIAQEVFESGTYTLTPELFVHRKGRFVLFRD